MFESYNPTQSAPEQEEYDSLASEPAPRCDLLLHGLGVVLARPGAVLWAYAFNLGLALLFSLRFSAQLSSILSHSLASQTLTTSFDAGTLAGTLGRLGDNAPSAGATNYLGLPLYALVYFVLVPGTLFSYITDTPARLSTLLSAGLLHFWRFVRITLLTAIVSALILGPLIALQGRWSDHVDDRYTGYAAIWHDAPLLVVIALIAALLRLYFDLVTAYTIQIGLHILPNGKPDRRVRRTLLPALRTLRHNFLRAYGSFVLISMLGLAALALGVSASIRSLPEPHVWRIFLFAQLGLLANLLARFWQRGAETVLVLDNPIQPPLPEPDRARFVPDAAPETLDHVYDDPVIAPVPEPIVEAPHSGLEHVVTDPIPDPEPASPSLPGPDRAVFLEERTRITLHREDDLSTQDEKS